jgi:thiamine pyrophosphokinase
VVIDQRRRIHRVHVDRRAGAGQADRVREEAGAPFTARDTVIVVSGGTGAGELGGVTVPPARWVIAADGGAATALELGLRVDELIGDMDSVSAADEARLAGSGGRVERYPEAKDATDLELALAAAASLDPAPRRVVVLGGVGGRLDHLLAGILVLAAPRWAGVDATGVHTEAWLGPAKVTVVRGRPVVDAPVVDAPVVDAPVVDAPVVDAPVVDATVLAATAPGELVSLLAVGGVAHGVTTSGLLYPLEDSDLAPGTTLGVSNEFAAARATVSVARGVVLAVQPGELGRHYRRWGGAGARG